MLCEQFKQAQEHGVEKDLKFKITFSHEQNLQGKKLKCAIDDYLHLTPDTTKQTKSKTTDDNDNGIPMELNDPSTHFKICFPFFKGFDNEEYKGKIIGYDSKHRLYEVEYEDGDSKYSYHNKMHAHRKQTDDPQVKQYAHSNNNVN